MHARRPLLAVLAALAVAGPLLPPLGGPAGAATAPAAAAPLPQAATPTYLVQKLRTGPHGIVYHRNSPNRDDMVFGMMLRRFDRARHELMPPSVRGYASVSGPLAITQSQVPDQGTATRAQIVNMLTGAVTYGDEVYEGGAGTRGSDIDYFVAATPDGWIDARVLDGVQHLVRAFTDGRPPVPILRGPQMIHDARADNRGAVLLDTTFASGGMNWRVVYVDFASGKATVLISDDGSGNGALAGIALAPSRLGWLHSSAGITTVSRADLSRRSTRNLGEQDAVGFAITDQAVAWVRDGRGNTDGPSYAYTAFNGRAPVRGPAVATASGMGAVDDGDFAFTAGSSSATHGVYRLEPGSGSWESRIDIAGEPLAQASDSGTSSRYTVAWTGQPGMTYDVEVAPRVRSSTGQMTWGAPRRWLTGTSATSAVYRNGPFRSGAGAQLRFTVRARNAAGSSRLLTVRAITTPYDDRSTTLRYSAGWKSHRQSDRWLSTLRSSGAAGRSVTVRRNASRITFIGDRCPTCGRIQLVVDGRKRPVVDLYSPTRRKRAVLASVALKRGMHTVKLVVVRTRGAAVRLDGVSVNR